MQHLATLARRTLHGSHRHRYGCVIRERTFDADRANCPNYPAWGGRGTRRHDDTTEGKT